VVIEAFVLAGGASQRMGSDKARLPCRGLPMAAAVAEVVGSVVDQVTVVRRDDDGLPWLDRGGEPLAVVYEPPHPTRHPLWGVAEALRQADEAEVLVVPCDLPGLTADHVAALLAAGGPCVAELAGHRHPLLAVLPRTLLPKAAALAARGEPARALVEALPGVELDPAGLVDTNTRVELGPTPLERLHIELPEGEATERLLRGEVARLAACGIVDPYAATLGLAHQPSTAHATPSPTP